MEIIERLGLVLLLIGLTLSLRKAKKIKVRI